PDDYKRCFLLPLDELRKVMRGGAVVIDKQDYISDALYQYLDRKVMIQIDLQDSNHVFAFTPDGKFIAECLRPGTVPALAETEADKKLLADEMKRQRGSLKAAGQAAAALTGGQLDKFSAQQLDQATSEQFRQLEDGRAQVRIAGEYHSVQGDHAAKIYSLPGSEPPAEQPPPQPAEEMSEEERKQRQEFFDAMYE
ncbi:MAG: Mu transposase C-terminal domain-containing protein, partial [Lentisphaeria bacterium]|nr:Mu transposase C-terminal domain-containing protein [Lentisphaeria bacterium]